MKGHLEGCWSEFCKWDRSYFRSVATVFGRIFLEEEYFYLCIYCSLPIKFYCFIHVPGIPVPTVYPTNIVQGTVVWARKVGWIPEETLE